VVLPPENESTGIKIDQSLDLFAKSKFEPVQIAEDGKQANMINNIGFNGRQTFRRSVLKNCNESTAL
jgi:hypothetical protein